MKKVQRNEVARIEFEETDIGVLSAYNGTTFTSVSPGWATLFGAGETAESTQRWRRMSDELRSLYQEARMPNWDGEGSRAIGAMTNELAMKLLASIPSRFPAPDISSDPQGRIHFEWTTNEKNIVAAAIDERGFIYFAAVVDGNRTNGVITDFSGTGFPKRLSDELRTARVTEIR